MGGKKSKGKQPKQDKKGKRGARSGNPAKRAAQLAAADERRATGGAGPGAGEPQPGQLPSAFGGSDDGQAPGDFELPDDIAQFLKRR